MVAGASEGGSGTHYLYIAADGLLIVGLVALLVLASRALHGSGAAVTPGSAERPRRG